MIKKSDLDTWMVTTWNVFASDSEKGVKWSTNMNGVHKITVNDDSSSMVKMRVVYEGKVFRYAKNAYTSV